MVVTHCNGRLVPVKSRARETYTLIEVLISIYLKTNYKLIDENLHHTQKTKTENVYVGVLAPEQKTVEPDHSKGGTELDTGRRHRAGILKPLLPAAPFSPLRNFYATLDLSAC